MNCEPRGINPEGLEKESHLYYQSSYPYIVKNNQILTQNSNKKMVNEKFNKKKDQLIRKARDIITTPGNINRSYI